MLQINLQELPQIRMLNQSLDLSEEKAVHLFIPGIYSVVWYRLESEMDRSYCSPHGKLGYKYRGELVGHLSWK